jgi:eukaryotic-like serine/threonine-protein kinase
MNAPDPSAQTVPLAPPVDAISPFDAPQPGRTPPASSERPGPVLTTGPESAGDVQTRDDTPSVSKHAPLIDVPGFDILGEIARGGMGVVYRARQRSLNRIVAIKCLPLGFANDPDRLARFRREAQAAAKFVNKGILPVYDVLEVGAVPLLVMPFIDGTDLARIITDRLAVRQGKPPKEHSTWAALSDTDYLVRILPVLDRAVEALTLLHRADVVHRDIKPSNILVDDDGHAWLSDFGLARFNGQEGLTVAGQGLGTPGYMSPEQWDGGGRVDGRADVFSMGVTLYQALTLMLPYGRERLSDDTRAPAAPTKHQSQLPAGMNAVILRAIAPDLSDRYRSAAELQEDWSRVRTGAPPRRRAPQRWRRVLRRRWPILAGAAGVLIALLVTFQLMSGGAPSSQAPFISVPRTVTITTEPAGADMVFVPLDPQYGEPDPEKAVWTKTTPTSAATVQLLPGTYFVEAQLADGRFHQVYRYVPKIDESMGQQADAYLAVYPQERWSDLPDQLVKLPTIRIPPADVAKGMATLAGGNFDLGTNVKTIEWAPSFPSHPVFIPPYCLDTHEVTEGEYRRWKQKRSQRRGLPINLFVPRGDDFPVTQVTYREAVSWAEWAGKRIPTEAEYEFAATNGNRTTYPWEGNADRIKEWRLERKCQPAWDHTDTKPPIYGLYSNVAEWTSTWRMDYPGNPPTAPNIDASTTRVYRGGPISVVKGSSLVTPECRLGPRMRNHLLVNSAEPGLGFRCARNVEPIFLGPRRAGH